MISVATSIDTPLPSKAFLKPFMPPTVAGCPPAKGAFAPESLLTMWSDWVEVGDVEPTLSLMLRTMAELC